MTATGQRLPVFTPGLSAADPLSNYWLRQVMLRLRREVCWMWQERSGTQPSSNGVTPPLVDRLSESLDRARYWEDKMRFWETDATARYLTTEIGLSPPHRSSAPMRGSFEWVVRQAELDGVSAFLLSLGLIASFDSAAGAVIAACQNDATRTSPTLALAQRLWDIPEDVLALVDHAHPLFRFGLLRHADQASAATEWDAPLFTPELVARRLLFAEALQSPSLVVISGEKQAAELSPSARFTALQLRSKTSTLRIVPVQTPTGASIPDVMTAVAELSERPVVELQGPVSSQSLSVAVTLCWLDGSDLSLRAGVPAQARDALVSCAAMPVTVFVGASARTGLEGIPYHLLSGALEIPSLTYAQRVERWTTCLAPVTPVLRAAIAETSRRFRYEAETIGRIAASLLTLPDPVTPNAITSACRSAGWLELGDLAQRVTPRFDQADELFLPRRQFDQFREVLHAMRSLADVHYRWGTARVWNEGGIAVLFAGPPGTGKTMAAEILASELDLPMYRIDLSQVVNKYIGETEKNLKRIFDAADASDSLLLFDEADSIFGKRMDARDAHDRYANLEISYLLERMERFKGLAVLATNRKKDLDEAFLRRLRYVIDFPLPGIEQRRRIWEQSIPPGVECSRVDLNFLAARFAMAGGHIRSVVFNACLQSAGRDRPPSLGMEEILVAVKRELDKINRPVGLDVFGEYAPLIRRMEHETEHNTD